MLSEADTHLITAAVDGELTPEQDRAFRTLIATSEAAAQLFAAIRDDRNRIAAMTGPKAPAKLRQAILTQLRPATPAARPVPARLRRSAFTPAAMAASFLLAVAAGAYWLAADNHPSRLTTKQLQQLPKDDLSPAPRSDAPILSNHEDALPIEMPEPKVPAVPSTAVARQETQPKTADSQPGLNPEQIHAAPTFGSDVKAFDRVDVKLPLLMSFSDFTREESQTSLRDRLARDPATRIDLFAKDTTRAVDSLIERGKALNLNVIVEMIAGERMKRKMPSTWVLYTDSLTPTEAARWLAITAEAEAKAESSSGKVFLAAHVLTAAANEQKEAQLLIGVDLGLGKKPTEVSGHIAAKTIDQVTSAIQKSDMPKPAIVLTYLPPLARVHPALSKDVKQYHELRKDRKPGTVQVMIVIRPGNV